MRMMLKVRMDVARANEAIRDGSLGKVIEETLTELKPESAYFLTERGERCGIFVFDMTDTSQIPVVAEPLFQAFGAKLTLVPVMNAEDLRKGLAAAAK
jgi:hypothetical protein